MSTLCLLICWGEDPGTIRQCPCLTDHRILILVFTILSAFANSYIERCQSCKGPRCRSYTNGEAKVQRNNILVQTRELTRRRDS